MKRSIDTGSMLLLGSFCLTLLSCGGGSGGSALPLGWVPTFGSGSGLDDGVHALAVFDDGSGSGAALYAGGSFTTAGGMMVNRIAKWNGSTWSALGTGTDEEVHALTAYDDGSGGGPALYAGGFFTTAGGEEVNRIAMWSGEAWSALGIGMNSSVLALTVHDDGSAGGPALYAGGSFTFAGGVSANRIAKWDGDSWSPLGAGMNGSVLALAVFDDGTGNGPALHAGGLFTTAGGVEVNGIARWNGNVWSALGAGVNGSVRVMAPFDDGAGGGPALYAGGVFTTADGLEVNGIARWDGSNWSALGTGVSGAVFALTVFDDGSGGGQALYAGGTFVIAGGVQANSIARWDGSNWSALGSGLSEEPSVGALRVYDDGSSSGAIPHGPSLFVGGSFLDSPAGDAFLAKWGRSDQAVLFGPEGAQQLSSLQPAVPDPQRKPCALTERLGFDLRLDDPGLHLLLEHAHVAPQRNVQWLAGTIELRGGLWRQAEPLVLGIAGPARLVLAEGARLEIPRVIVGPQGELLGEGLLLGDLESQGLVAPSGGGLELQGRYLESPPGILSGELHSPLRARAAGASARVGRRPRRSPRGCSPARCPHRAHERAPRS